MPSATRRRNQTEVQTFSAGPGLLHRIKDLSERDRDGSVSETIRKALTEYLEKHNA